MWAQVVFIVTVADSVVVVVVVVVVVAAALALWPGPELCRRLE